jgi:hypothetical protein
MSWLAQYKDEVYWDEAKDKPKMYFVNYESLMTSNELNHRNPCSVDMPSRRVLKERLRARLFFNCREMCEWYNSNGLEGWMGGLG